MAAINQGGTFYRLDKSSQSGDCGQSKRHGLARKQVMPFAFAVKGFRSAIASLKLKRKATASEQDHSRPSLHAMSPVRLAASTHNLYKEVILSRRPFNEGVKGACTPPPPTPLRTCSPSHDPALKNNRLPSGTRSEQSLFL